MLYKKNSAASLSDELFQNPTCEYRGTPFWAWNCKLERNELMRQIKVLKQMGFGGFHVHVRSGMATPYLSDEFMELVGACVDKARDEDMLAWLYDEDRWPSGFAGGYVTEDPQYRIRYLLFTPTPYEQEGGKHRDGNEQATALRSGLGHLMAVYDVELDSDGCLQHYERVSPDATPRGRLWYAYLEQPHPSPRYNGQTYVNTLDRKAIERFLEVTHDRYYERFGNEFDVHIPAIFTDEPQMTHKSVLEMADVPRDVAMPWTDDLPDTYREAYGDDIMELLPELFWELPRGEVSVARYRIHNHIADRFASAFADTIGDWCRGHGIMMTGHVMCEPTLDSQTRAVGEAMRSYRAFQLPGIDMLACRRELTTAKQAQSAVHQYGREGMMSELYGVTGWDFDFRGHKLHGDWQAALGVTVRVPHLSWVSMEGEAKRDYPASISYQSSWYTEYSYIEDHFARLNTAMTRGVPEVRVGVIHPIESMWLHWGPSDQTALVRSQLDSSFKDVTSWLLYGTIDFDFISEALLPELCDAGSNPLKVGKMAYDVILVPCCETLRSTTVERLLAFVRDGGKLMIVGSTPKYIDAMPQSGELDALCSAAKLVPLSRAALLSSLEPFRTVEIRSDNGSLTDNLLYQLRRDGKDRWLFIANGKDPYNNDISRRQSIRITVPGHWNARVYNTLDGTISTKAVTYRGDSTVITHSLYQHDSLLLRLSPDTSVGVVAAPSAEKLNTTVLSLPFSVRYSLDEPNALLLDTAEYSFDGGQMKPLEELLRIDTACRTSLGWTPWSSSSDQPWHLPADPPAHRIYLRFTFESDIDYIGAHLALETPELAQIIFNSQPVNTSPDGWYVDKAIKTVGLPPIVRGTNTLEITYLFGRRTAVEWCYILGNFGVSVHGRGKRITSPPDKLFFGSITDQGLPFYSGAITYHLNVDTDGEALELTLPQYRAGVPTVSFDDGTPRHVAFAPYCTTFENVTPGNHRVDIKLYLTRFNGFGPLHCADDKCSYPSPGVYRTTGDRWCYEYRLKPQGLLVSPQIRLLK